MNQGHKIHNLAKKLWPLNRSITGKGFRDSLSIIKEIIPNMKVYKIESGTKVFDWEVPLEWNIKEAYIIDPKGRKICDYSKNNLYVVGYSCPIQKSLSLEELEKNLYSLPDQPNAIPYITSYYKKRWGFCIKHNDRMKLEKGIYNVVIKSTLKKGFLNYGEILIKGKEKKKFFYLLICVIRQWRITNYLGHQF